MESFKTIEEARRFASKISRECNCDMGVEKAKEYTNTVYRVAMLPRPENRYGWELRCEVVKPTDPIWS